MRRDTVGLGHLHGGKKIVTKNHCGVYVFLGAEVIARNVFVLIAATGALAACSPTTPWAGGAVPTPARANSSIGLENYSAPGNRSSQIFRDDKGIASASVKGTTLEATLSNNIGGTTGFSVGNGTPVNTGNGVTTMAFAQGTNWGRAYQGAYSSAYTGGSTSNFNAWALVDGEKTDTATITKQQATYSGNWNMFYNDRAPQSGQFTASADFNAKTIGLNMTGAASGVGGGTISGNGFNAAFDLNTPGIVPVPGSVAVPNPYNVRGSFFGPNAVEMGGIISHINSGFSHVGPDAEKDPTFPTVMGGVMWGKQQ